MRADDALKKQKMPFKIFFKSRCDYEIEYGWKGERKVNRLCEQLLDMISDAVVRMGKSGLKKSITLGMFEPKIPEKLKK